MPGRSTESLGRAKTVLDLSVIAPGSYFLDGAYGISEASFALPLQAQFEVELMPNVLEVVGTWQQHSGRPTHAFRLEIIRDHTSQSQADVAVSGTLIRALRGRASLKRPAFEMLAADESREQFLSAHFTASPDSGMFEVSGFICVGPSTYYSFEGRAIPTEGRASLSNVVSIMGGKVA